VQIPTSRAKSKSAVCVDYDVNLKFLMLGSYNHRQGRLQYRHLKGDAAFLCT
jgi:hypothetical protein